MAKFSPILGYLLLFGMVILGMPFAAAVNLMTCVDDVDDEDTVNRTRWWRQRVADLWFEYFGADPPVRESGQHRLEPEGGRHHLRIPCRDLLAQFGL